jgi:predicted amidohydrolase
MPRMRIAIAQLNTLIGDIDGAAAAIRAAANKAVYEGADLLVCSELAACGGYPPRDLLALVCRKTMASGTELSARITAASNYWLR